MIRQTAILILLGSLIGALPLCAELVVTGPPVLGNSWGLPLLHMTASLFDTIKVEALNPSGWTFKNPTLSPIFLGSGWIQSTALDGRSATASGLAVNALGFQVWFTNSYTDPVAFRLTSYSGATPVESWRFSGSFPNQTLTQLPTQVPEAGAAALRGGWLLGLGLLLFRRKA